MKKAAALLLAIIPISASAAFRSIPTEKVIDFLKKKEACLVAFGEVNGGTVLNPVYCVWDGLAHEGTINESKGCFLGRYDVDVGGYSRLMNAGAGIQGRSQPDGMCTKELIRKMLTEYPISDFVQIGSSQEPVLVNFRKQDKHATVFYDPEGIFTPEIMEGVDHWKSTKKKKTAIKIDCKSDVWPPGVTEVARDIACSTPDELFAQVCNGRGDPTNDQRKAAYLKKKSEPMPKCPPGIGE